MTAATLTELLTLIPSEAPDTFIGSTEAYGTVGVYGGHFLGQALAAAFETVDEDKHANSFHAYFLKAGDPTQPLIYRVERTREGRGYDTRLVNAIQGANTVFTMLASFKLPEPGETHQKPMPGVIAPEELLARRTSASGEPVRFPMTIGGRVELELISDHFIPKTFLPGRKPELQAWMRVPSAGVISPRLTQCMLAFLADGTLMFNSVLPYGLPFQTHRLTSLDQSVWFHHPCDLRDWLFYDQRSTAVADSRGLNEGEVFDRTGNLIMSTSQESMLRRL